jgi:hypothetical protein
MTEFADIFAYGLTTAVYMLGSAAMLIVLAGAMLAMGHDPVALDRELQTAV